jgi:exodeoxyribonuclease VII large subunit
VYEPQGAYQLYAEFVAPEGIGEAELRLEELRLRLEGEGLFEPSRKRPLPSFPRRIGIVTSATGAVIHDVRTVLARRWPLVQLVLAPSLVQGEDAPEALSRALYDLNRLGEVDVIIVARGGGSREDLMAFNDEQVARAIFGSRVPVVSAVGHEVDVTIADLVADQRAPTPSAAAELVSPDGREVSRDLSNYAASLRWHLTRRLAEARDDLAAAASALERRSPVAVIRERRDATALLAGRLDTAARHALELRDHRLRARALQLAALDPVAILRRGYSVTYEPTTRRPITSIQQIYAGARLQTRLEDGTFDSTVNGLSAGEEKRT